MMRYALGVILLLVVGSSQAAPVTIDFEEFVFPEDTLTLVESLESKSYTFQAIAPGANFATLGFPVGNNVVGTCSGGPSCGLTLTHSINPTFSIQSFDYYVNDISLGDCCIPYLEITGYLEGGGELSQLLYWTGATQLSTHYFSSEWSNLVAFEATGTSGAYDNFVVTSVPVPAAVWLFGSALAGLGWLRRNRRGYSLMQ
jgi:hypothetical protein